MGKQSFFPRLKRIKKRLASVFLVSLVWTSGLVSASEMMIAQTVTASFKNANLNEIIWELQKQTDFTFIYSTNEVQNVRVNDLNAENEDLAIVLEKCLKNSGLTYTVRDGVIAIKKDTRSSEPKVTTAAPQQQKITIQGNVTDEFGDPLMGVNVMAMGTTLGVITDIDGNFAIQLDNASQTLLQFSFIGFEKIEAKATPGQTMYIVMTEDNNLLSEVVITGYGTYKKSAYAGSASTVKMQNLEEVPAVDFATLLQGNASGVMVNSTSGQPGSETDISIRGIGSFNASTSPLFVIDGIPVMSGSLNTTDAGTDIMSTINTSDIENITVIKDAAAASLYGSRAANGVILITTKSGKEGKPVFNLKTDWGFSNYATKYRETLSGQDRRDIIYEGLINKAVRVNDLSQAEAIEFADANIDRYAPVPYNGWADWESALFRKNALYQNYEFSASGSDGKMSYFTSLAYTDQDGLTYQSAFKRISGRLNVKYQMSKNLQLGANILYSNISQDVNSEGGTYTSPIYSSRHKVSPSDPVYNEDGSYNTNLLANSRRNPKMASDMNYRRQKADRSFNTIYANYTFIDGLVFNTTLSLDHTNTKYKAWDDPRSSDGSTTLGSLTSTFYQYDQLVWKNNLTYVKTFAQKHNLDVLVGYETDQFKREHLSGSKTTFPNVEKQEISNGSSITGLTGYTRETRLVSYLSRVNYNYDNKYFIGASARIDGSSKLHKDNRWGTFWSVSGAWRLSDEAFMESASDFLSETKIRASFGSNGTLPDDYFGYMDLVQFGYNYNGYPGILEKQLGNMDLTWEKNYNLNIGVDFRLFNRVSATVEYYSRKTSDLLLDLPISMTTGFSSLLSNIGTMRNRGVEVEITAEILKGKDLTWNSSLNFGHNKNKILDLGGQEKINPRSFQIHKVGETYNSFYVVEFAGIDPDTGIPQYYVNGENDDANNREITEDASKATPILYKNPEPKLSGGWTNSLRYKMFDLNFTFTYSLGGYSYDYGASKLEHGGAEAMHNIQAFYKDRWQKPGDQTKYEIFIVDNPYDMSTVANSRRVHSTNHLRLKNMTVGFTVPRKYVEKMKLTNVRAYCSAVNLLTFAAYDGYDPEISQKGYIYFDFPKLKTITFGLDIKF